MLLHGRCTPFVAAVALVSLPSSSGSSPDKYTKQKCTSFAINYHIHNGTTHTLSLVHLHPCLKCVQVDGSGYPGVAAVLPQSACLVPVSLHKYTKHIHCKILPHPRTLSRSQLHPHPLSVPSHIGLTYHACLSPSRLPTTTFLRVLSSVPPLALPFFHHSKVVNTLQADDAENSITNHFAGARVPS